MSLPDTLPENVLAWVGNSWRKSAFKLLCFVISLFFRCMPRRGKYSLEKPISVTILGDFLKFLSTNLLTKVAQKDCRLLGSVWNRSIYVKSAVDIWATFLLQHLVTLKPVHDLGSFVPKKFSDRCLRLCVCFLCRRNSFKGGEDRTKFQGRNVA